MFVLLTYAHELSRSLYDGANVRLERN